MKITELTRTMTQLDLFPKELEEAIEASKKIEGTAENWENGLLGTDESSAVVSNLVIEDVWYCKNGE
jgi:hypothetical protein